MFHGLYGFQCRPVFEPKHLFLIQALTWISTGFQTYAIFGHVLDKDHIYKIIDLFPSLWCQVPSSRILSKREFRPYHEMGYLLVYAVRPIVNQDLDVV